SFFGRLNYSFMNKYLITATLRDDGTSRFAKNHRWGLFPSVALGWRVKEEAFLKDVDAVSDLKLRLGYGITGQQDLQQGDYPYMPTYFAGQDGAYYQFGTDKQIAISRPNGFNPDLKWEETTTWNAGLDFGFINNRITAAVDYYYRETKDLINVIDVPAGTNFKNRIVSNIGSLKNKGLEFSINAKPISTRDWMWDLGFNVAWNNTEITQLTAQDNAATIVPTGYVDGGTGTMVQAQGVGNPINSFYVYQQVYDEAGKPIEGLYVDRNGDGQVNESDKYFYKKPAADVTMGFTSKLIYKSWDFSFSLRANLNNYVYNNVASFNAPLSEGWINNKGYLSNRPFSAFDTNFQNMNVLSDYYVQNASFLRCDNITLGYSFKNLFKCLNGRVYGTVQNPFVITKYDGLDPEVNGGIDKNVYPRPFVGIFGLSLNF
ncbi:MAG: TonB-dependent receptor, partial [Bacteroides sp.]